MQIYCHQRLLRAPLLILLLLCAPNALYGEDARAARLAEFRREHGAQNSNQNNTGTTESKEEKSSEQKNSQMPDNLSKTDKKIWNQIDQVQRAIKEPKSARAAFKKASGIIRKKMFGNAQDNILKNSDLQEHLIAALMLDKEYRETLINSSDV